MASSSTRATTPAPGAIKQPRVTRFRVIAIAVVSALAVLGGISVWRMRSLGDLPDIGDPFDMEFVRRPIVISDRDNAFEAYARARITKEPPPPEVWEALP